MIEGMSYRELQKKVAEKTDINPFGKKKDELIKILSDLEIFDSLMVEPILEKSTPKTSMLPTLPKSHKDFNLMTWDEGHSYIKWAAEEVGYSPKEVKLYLEKSGFLNYSTQQFDEIYTAVAREKYQRDLIIRKIHK